MTKDCQGNELEQGDNVVLHCKVLGITEGEVVTMRLLQNGGIDDVINCDAKHLIKVKKPDDVLASPQPTDPAQSPTGPGFGQMAYEAYSAKSEGKSLVSGKPLPTWADVDPRIKDAWEAAAFAVYDSVMPGQEIRALNRAGSNQTPSDAAAAT